jgi:hypothetical protein
MSRGSPLMSLGSPPLMPDLTRGYLSKPISGCWRAMSRPILGDVWAARLGLLAAEGCGFEFKKSWIESSLFGDGCLLLLYGEASGAMWLPLPIRELDLLPLGLLVFRLLSSLSSGLLLFTGLDWKKYGSFTGGAYSIYGISLLLAFL